MLTVSEEVRRAYAAYQEKANGNGVNVPYELTLVLANFARDAVADKMKADFQRDHGLLKNFCPRGAYKHEPGLGDVIIACDDHRHTWTDAQWQAAADLLLKGEERGACSIRMK